MLDILNFQCYSVYLTQPTPEFYHAVSSILSNFLIIPVVKENIRVKLAPAISIGASTTPTEETIKTLPLVALKTIFRLCLCNQT